MTFLFCVALDELDVVRQNGDVVLVVVCQHADGRASLWETYEERSVWREARC
jgi:hypothetical protein